MCCVVMASTLSLSFCCGVSHRTMAVQSSRNAARPVGRRRELGTPQELRLECVGGKWGRNSSSICGEESLSESSFSRVCCSRALNSSEATADNGDEEEEEEEEEEGMGLSTFEEFVQLNSGSWGGHFYQFDVLGRTLQQIPTRLYAYSHGKGADLTLFQTLNIKQAFSKTSVPDEVDEPAWAEFKLNETNLSTVDRPQQTVYFPGERAYCLSHQTAEMVDKVLRAGVLGEDDDENEECPNGVKLPSRRPALVSESCLYSDDGHRRVRAFIVLDPRGLLDVIGVLNEKKLEGDFVELPNDFSEEDATEKVNLMVGKWAGPSVTRRTGIYGSTVVENDVAVRYEKLPGGFVAQEFASSRGYKVRLTGQIKGCVFEFEGGLQTILLPGGIAVSAPISVGRSVGRSQSFFFEFSWMESPTKRRRLVRTYDTDGLVVSTTLSWESKH